ncbi:MAG TPA: Mrp/NBP35 family ATP-binding protein [Candidatus Kapabacteria bacterium]|jgi:ATP-binding protein involved in chromosome partitioning|nr:Mrp/NBP35 family ATP-binding protein [Candidatus Kapabacteria bacterium]HRI30007.1 Mrp/NBP35 family ATP-binding protein [Candidatus Kapabacteria bacterium]HRK60217.1 Mrp/NBP35 family ATP-binding protein [Candidatus Kapabacteria bacterium]
MNQLVETQIREAVGQVADNDLGFTLAELNAISNIQLSDNAINVYLELIPPVHWVAQTIDQRVKQAVAAIAPGSQITVFVREKEVPRLANAGVLPNVSQLIAVASGKGGVGKSTIAANLAAALAQKGARVGLLDADIYGPSQPTMFGMADEQMRAEKTEDGRVLGFPNEQYGVKVASIGFVMERDQAAIMRGPMLAGYFTTLVEQIAWGELDFLVFDLPPGTGDIQLTLTQKIPLTGAVMVTTPQEISLADVRRSISMFRKVNVDILGVIENMSYFIPPDMPEKRYDIFGRGGGKMAALQANVPFLGEVPLTLGTRSGGDEGMPVVLNPDDFSQGQLLREITASVVSQVRKVNLKKMEQPVVQITL